MYINVSSKLDSILFPHSSFLLFSHIPIALICGCKQHSQIVNIIQYWHYCTVHQRVTTKYLQRPICQLEFSFILTALPLILIFCIRKLRDDIIILHFINWFNVLFESIHLLFAHYKKNMYKVSQNHYTLHN